MKRKRYERGELAPNTKRAIGLIERGHRNKQISKLLNMTPRRVSEIRCRHTSLAGKHIGGIPRVKHDESFLRRLGRETDSYIAKQYGLTRERIRQIRQSLGIPKAVKKYVFEDELGKEHDRVIAERYGYGSKTIGHIRRRRGIPCLGRWSSIT